MKKSFFFYLLAATLFFGHTLVAQTTENTYTVTPIKVVGDGGWDEPTLDDATQRLYISHGDMVQVLDVKSSKVIGTIPDTKGVHAITLANDLNKGFISNGKDNSVTIFKLSDFSTITKIAVTGSNPDEILYDAFSHKVFVFNGKSNNATVIDAKTEKVIATIALEGQPEFSKTDGKGILFVNIESKSEIAVINTTTLKVEKYWRLAPGTEPSGLAIDLENHRLFSVCSNKFMVILDATTGALIDDLPIGKNPDGVVFDPVLKRIYSSNGEGTITVVQEIDADHFKVIEQIPTRKGARTITISNSTHHLYLPVAEKGPVPSSTKENPIPRAPVIPGTFVILDVSPDKK